MDYSIFDELEDMSFEYEERFEDYGVTHALINKESEFYMILLK